MPPRKQRNRDQQPELRLVDQQSEQSAGEQRPSLKQAKAAAEQAAVQVLLTSGTAAASMGLLALQAVAVGDAIETSPNICSSVAIRVRADIAIDQNGHMKGTR